MFTLFASFVTIVMPLMGGSSLFVNNHATTSATSPSSLILRRQLRGLPCRPPPLPRRQDVIAASFLSGSFLRRLAIAASLLSGSFLHRLAIAAIPKIQRCRCRSPFSSPPSSRRFLSSASSSSPRMSLPPLFSLVLSFVGSPSPPSPRSSAAVTDLLPLPLLHRPAATSCRPPPLPRRQGCCCRLFSLWFFPSSAHHRRLSSLVLSFVGSPSPSSPRSSAAVADLLPLPLHRPVAASCSSPAMPLLLASSPLSTFFSFSVDLCASSSSAFRHYRLPVFRPHPVHG